MANLELKIAGVNKISLDAASIILKTLTKKVKELSDIQTAEASTLFTISKQDTDRALASELAIFCENANINYFKTLKQLDINDPSFWPAIIEGENHDEAYFLLDGAENLNAKLRLPVLARQINEDMVKHAVNLTQNALRRSGKTLRRAKVAVLGAANPTLSLGAFVKMVEAKGAKVSIYDPLSKNGRQEWSLVKTALSEAVEGTDCLVILAEREHLKNFNLKKLKALMKTPSVIVDLMGALEAENVETEGFIYCGFGKGVD